MIDVFAGVLYPFLVFKNPAYSNSLYKGEKQ